MEAFARTGQHVEAFLSHFGAGVLYINVPFAGKFEERPVLVNFLRREVLNRRPEIRLIRIFAAWQVLAACFGIWGLMIDDLYNEFIAGRPVRDVTEVTDVQDFFSGGQAKPSYDPNIWIAYAVQASKFELLQTRIAKGEASITPLNSAQSRVLVDAFSPLPSLDAFGHCRMGGLLCLQRI